MPTEHARLAVIIVSANSASWLPQRLTTLFQHAGDVDLEVVVVASGCTDETIPLVRREFPAARTISCVNRGFAYANNQALRTIQADWVLFLNPDTEILEGSLSDLVAEVRRRPTLGLVGVRQLMPDGDVFPTIRRFPNAIRSLFEALGSERFPVRASWLGERELNLNAYDHDVACDWTTGSFMLARRDALRSAGFFDERFFLYCEETDLCLRIKQAGWDIRHLPHLTILHHAGEGWVESSSRGAGRLREAAVLRQALLACASTDRDRCARARVFGSRGTREREHGPETSSRAALTTLLGIRPPPFGAPPPVAVGPDPELSA